jgi:hypothetical protein
MHGAYNVKCLRCLHGFSLTRFKEWPYENYINQNMEYVLGK